MESTIKFTARDTVVDGVAQSRQSEAKSDKQLLAVAIKAVLFGGKNNG